MKEHLLQIPLKAAGESGGDQWGHPIMGKK